MHSFMPQSLANVTWSYASREKQMHHDPSVIVIRHDFSVDGKK